MVSRKKPAKAPAKHKATPSAGKRLIPGEIVAAPGEIEINRGRATVKIDVANAGDRPIQVGSHYHFFEANRALEFDRETAFGMHLDIPAGTAVRFEPGESKEVTLVAFGGSGEVFGLNRLTDGSIRQRLQVSRERMVAEDWRRANEKGREALCQAIGRAAFDAGFEGILVPSAQDENGRNLIVFPDQLKPDSGLEEFGAME